MCWAIALVYIVEVCPYLRAIVGAATAFSLPPGAVQPRAPVARALATLCAGRVDKLIFKQRA